MLDLSNFSVNKKDDEDAEVVRERNIDRLRLLSKHEESERKRKGSLYYNYTEREEEDLSNRLERTDA